MRNGSRRSRAGRGANFAHESLILQSRDEAAVQQPSGFNQNDHLTGDWGGLRDRLFDSGIEVFAFYNSIFNGNVSGGIHPRHATYVDDAWLGFKFDLEKLVGWRGGLFVISGIKTTGPPKYIGSIYSTQQSWRLVIIRKRKSQSSHSK